MKLQQNLLYGVCIATAAMIIAVQTAFIGSAQDGSPGSGDPTAVCEKFPLLDRLDCQTCISKGQPTVRCETEAFLGEGPLRKMMKGGATPTVINQFPVTVTPSPDTIPQPLAFPTITPLNTQVWGLLPQPRNPGLMEPQPIASGSITKGDISNWCKALNTANGIADYTLKINGAAEILGLTTGQAETVAETARAAASKRTLVFLIAAGAAVYVLSKQCTPSTQ
jgi:hypothetical protein